MLRQHVGNMFSTSYFHQVQSSSKTHDCKVSSRTSTCFKRPAPVRFAHCNAHQLSPSTTGGSFANPCSNRNAGIPSTSTAALPMEYSSASLPLSACDAWVRDQLVTQHPAKKKLRLQTPARQETRTACLSQGLWPEILMLRHDVKCPAIWLFRENMRHGRRVKKTLHTCAWHSTHDRHGSTRRPSTPNVLVIRIEDPRVFLGVPHALRPIKLAKACGRVWSPPPVRGV